MGSVAVYETSFGEITVASNGKAIVLLKLGRIEITSAFLTDELQENDNDGRRTDVLTDCAAKQLEEYFSGKRQVFDIPISPGGTAFQCSVWSALLRIPYGETRSYKQIAQDIGNSNACRAVGMANNRNPIWIIIPCHRVIGADGSLTGYGGGLEMKERLLRIEAKHRI